VLELLVKEIMVVHRIILTHKHLVVVAALAQLEQMLQAQMLVPVVMV
jgi:hypothetical protein